MNVLACDIGGTRIKLGLCNPSGKLQEYQEYATDAARGGIHLVERVMEWMSLYSNYEAIAVSTAGQVHPADGSIRYANPNIPKYTGVQVKSILEERFHKPVRIENDVNAAALGEAWIGAGHSFEDFICLTFGTGIGGAIVLQRKIYKGFNGAAGEFGHMFMLPVTGSTGSTRDSMYESLASTTALVHKARAIRPFITNGRELLAEMEEGDRELQAVLEKWEIEVSRGMATLIHIFNPPALIVGGGIMEQEWLVSRIADRTRELLLDSFKHTPIFPAKLGNKAGLIGAASLFYNSINN